MNPCIEFLLTQFVLLHSIHVLRLLYVIHNLLCTDSVRKKSLLYLVSFLLCWWYAVNMSMVVRRHMPWLRTSDRSAPHGVLCA